MLRAYFKNADDGEMVPFPRASELTEIHRAFLNASLAVGMPRLNETTINEFVRRIELYQTYTQAFLYDKDGQVDLTRKMLLDMLGDTYTAACTNVTPLTRRDFDAAMKKEEAAFNEAARRRKAAQA